MQRTSTSMRRFTSVTYETNIAGGCGGGGHCLNLNLKLYTTMKHVGGRIHDRIEHDV